MYLILGWGGVALYAEIGGLVNQRQPCKILVIGVHLLTSLMKNKAGSVASYHILPGMQEEGGK